MMANWKSSDKLPIFVRQNTDPILQQLITDREWEQGALQCSAQPSSHQYSSGICYKVYGHPFELCSEKVKKWFITKL